MPKNNQQSSGKTQGLYDRIADVHHLTMKLNRYEKSVAKYLNLLDLNLNADSLVLDAGSGTGIITQAFHSSGLPARRVVSLDLSLNSLIIARDELSEKNRFLNRTSFVESNVLAMPFADDTFDIALTCGVLEYTPIDKGLGEIARVLKHGAPLVMIPVKPSFVGSVLELLYKFKLHPLDKVRTAASRYFRLVGNHEFPITEPISWSKTIFLLEKK